MSPALRIEGVRQYRQIEQQVGEGRRKVVLEERSMGERGRFEREQRRGDDRRYR